MPPYPGLGKNLRYLNQGGSTCDLYPIGIHANCYGADSEMLFVREVAMMIVMDQLTEKPDFHIKVYDETITNRWIEEALAIPDHVLYDQIVGGRGDGFGDHPKRLKSILDRQCLQYVRTITIYSHMSINYQQSMSVHRGTTNKSQVLLPDRAHTNA